MARKRPLLKQMTTSYVDLVNAIKNQNFEAIENLCEHNLTQEVASSMYELQKFHNIQFRILNQEYEKDIYANIINHFYIVGMEIERKENPNLNQLKMVRNQGGDRLIYVDKDADEGEVDQSGFY